MTTTARSALLAELLAGEDPAADTYQDAAARVEGLVDDAIAEGIRNAQADSLSGQHYAKAVQLLAETATVVRPNDEGHCEADRMIAEANVHALLAIATRPTNDAPACQHGCPQQLATREPDMTTACSAPNPPADLPIRIRISPSYLGENRVAVVDAVTGKRPRSILVSQLHDSPTTRTGQLRRTGYVLETEPTEGP